GSVTRVGADRARVTLRLRGTGRGDVVAEVDESGPLTSLDAIALAAAASFRKTLDVAPPTQADIAHARARVPQRPDAAERYTRGLVRMRGFAVRRARDLLAEAVLREDDSPGAHLALARASATLSHVTVARDEAKRAFDLSAGMSREDRL